MKQVSLYMVILGIILSSGCSTGNDDDKYHDIPAKKLFDMAQTEVAKERYPEAIEMFESFDAQYPTSEYAEQALLEYIYAQYKVEEHGLAVAAASRFLRLYPGSKNADYVLYLKGVINSEQERSLFDQAFKEDLSLRDVTFFREAYMDFVRLVDSYPNSPYSSDARHRMIFLRNLLAQSELNIAEFYFKNELYVAAVNRSVYIVENYSQSLQALRALEIIIEANKQMDFTLSMREAIKIVKLNFPDSDVLKNL
jgi:outer membrane protein assembly factor BamD